MLTVGVQLTVTFLKGLFFNFYILNYNRFILYFIKVNFFKIKEIIKKDSVLPKNLFFLHNLTVLLFITICTIYLFLCTFFIS